MDRYLNENELLENKLALNIILKYYKSNLISESSHRYENLEYMLTNLIPARGLNYRLITLKESWYKNCTGALIGKMKSGETIVFLPKVLSGYKYINCRTKKVHNVTKKSVDLFESGAIAFNKSLPEKTLDIWDFFKYMISIIPSSKYILLFLANLIVSLLGLVLPRVNNLIFSDIIINKSYSKLLSVTYVLFLITIAETLFTIISRTLVYNIRTIISVSSQNALMSRILSLPVSFFKEYSSGDIAKRLQNFISVISVMIDTIAITILSVLFSSIYIVQIARITPTLSIPVLIISLVMLTCIIVFIVLQTKVYIKMNKNDVKVSSKFFSLICGIQKLKLAGAEEKAFSYWNESYKKSAKLLYNPPFILKIQTSFGLISSYASTIIIYYIAAASNISIASFMSFIIAFNMITASLTSLANISIVFAQFYSTIKILTPILSTIPDQNYNNRITQKLSGNIKLNNVSFKYSEKSKNVINNFSLDIAKGEYLAITGPTGCGKSTLLRLLLGFDSPQSGSIRYDNIDINSLNIRSLRKQIGTVLQDGKLFPGSIFDNITFFEPVLTIEDAWKAAEIAQIADDIRNMPMGMFTIISEGDGSISGGQKQRILIARAVVSNPKILILDEATSALDNITQKNLVDSLQQLNCTKIVIAHRLSTLQFCDKIIMIENGKIIEEGTYNSLINNKQKFFYFVKRQQASNI